MSLTYILLFTVVSVSLGLVFMSFMTSEADSAGEWFQQSVLGRGLPQDEKELKRRRDAKMERLLNEKIRVSSPKKAPEKEKEKKARKDATDTTATATEDRDAPELRPRKTRQEGRKEK